eukprot:8658675-Ditylum_brightwellii.AAC.1
MAPVLVNYRPFLFCPAHGAALCLLLGNGVVSDVAVVEAVEVALKMTAVERNSNETAGLQNDENDTPEDDSN